MRLVHSKGFSFLELLLATVLITVGLAGLVNVFSIGLTQNRQAKSYVVAKSLAEEKMEEIMSLEFSHVVDEPVALVDGFEDYQSQVEVSDIKQGLKQATVTVSWQEKAQPVSLTLVTAVCE